MECLEVKRETSFSMPSVSIKLDNLMFSFLKLLLVDVRKVNSSYVFWLDKTLWFFLLKSHYTNWSFYFSLQFTIWYVVFASL